MTLANRKVVLSSSETTPPTNEARMIRLIVEVITSERDRYGNCYHVARLTSTATGRSLLFHTDGDRNTTGKLLNMGYGWSDFYCVNVTIGKKCHRDRFVGVTRRESEVTDAMIKSLQRKNGKQHVQGS